MSQTWCVVAPLALVLGTALHINCVVAWRPDVPEALPRGGLNGSFLLRKNRAKLQSFDSNVEAAFAAFIERYSRTYKPGDLEYEHRRPIFAASFSEVQLQNSKPNRLWNAAINKLSDRTKEEMEALNGWRGRSAAANRAGSGVPGFQPHLSSALVQQVQKAHHLPEEVNWTHLWTATENKIRNQRCADCWAAATVSMLEAHAEIHMGIKRTFSEGELASCTPDPWQCGGDGGCAGSTSELALEQVLLNGLGEDEASEECPKARGMVANTDEDKTASHEWGPGVRLLSTRIPKLGEMPQIDPIAADSRPKHAPRDFTGAESGSELAQRDVTTAEDRLTSKQHRTSPSLAFGMYGWERLPENRYWPLIHALVERGPVAVAVSTDWKDYSNGVHEGCNKNARIGHAVLLMGYGQLPEAGPRYWLLQNSWGPDWGEKGHIRLRRADTAEAEESYCGEDEAPQEGTTCKNGPKTVRVCGQCGILYDTTVPYFQSNTELSRQMAALRSDHA